MTLIMTEDVFVSVSSSHQSAALSWSTPAAAAPGFPASSTTAPATGVRASSPAAGSAGTPSKPGRSVKPSAMKSVRPHHGDLHTDATQEGSLVFFLSVLGLNRRLGTVLILRSAVTNCRTWSGSKRGLMCWRCDLTSQHSAAGRRSEQTNHSLQTLNPATW